MGISLAAEEPKCPNLVIHNFGGVKAEESAAIILKELAIWENIRAEVIN